MAKNKRLGVSIFVVILSIIMALSIIFTFSISYMFSSDGISGKLFGSYIYIMDTADMTPEIEKDSAVISDPDAITVLTEGNVILFKNGNRENVMRIREVIHNTDSTIYSVSLDKSPDRTLEISKDKVMAKCINESHNLGAVISFLSSMAGIIVGMLLPCGIILAMLIMKILSMKKHRTDDEFEDDIEENDDDDDSTEFEGFNGKQVRANPISPLFNPESDINPDDDFERRKSSIADNFRQKNGIAPKRPARGNQKAAPKEAVKKFKAAVDEKPPAPVTRKSTLIPEDVNPERSEKLAAIKAALSNKDEGDNTSDKNVVERPQNILERTASFKALKHMDTTPVNSGIPIQRKSPVEKPVEKKKPANSNSDINSIDDLIKALEEEKKKL